MQPLYVKNPLLEGKKVVIYGTDEKAVLTFTALLQNEVYVSCFCNPDAKSLDLKIMNKSVISKEELDCYKNESIIVIGGLEHMKKAEMLEQEGFQVFYDFNLSSYEGNSVWVQGE